MVAFGPTLRCLRRARVTIPRLSPTHTRAKIVEFLVNVDGHVGSWSSTSTSSSESSSATTTTTTATTTTPSTTNGVQVECYTPVFVLKCSPDLVTEGYRQYDDHEPCMLIESHEEGTFQIHNNHHTNIQLDKWYPVGTEIGVIDDGEENDDTDKDNDEWLWQAYSHEYDDA
jgi:hypothetical protein